jgi:hypothetical protein
MNCIRYWTVTSVIAALILLSPVVAFLMVIAVEVLIDGLMEAGVTGVSAIAMPIRSPLRLEKSAALIARRDGAED